MDHEDGRRRWRDMRMPPDEIRTELMEMYHAACAASLRGPVAVLAPEGWWPDVVKVLGLPVVRRGTVTELSITTEPVPELADGTVLS